MLDLPIVGVALDDWDDDALRKHAREAVEATVKSPDSKALDAMLARLTYVQGDYGDEATFERVKKALGDAKQPVFYLEIPPSLFATVVKGLGKAGLVEHAHVVIEKPFGHDLESARALNAELTARCWKRGRSSASTTTSARSRCWTSPTCASPTRSSSRSGTASTSPTCR